MNIKAYIDYFEELKELKRDEQFERLEKARDEVIEKAKLPVFDIMSYVTPVFCLLILVGTGYFLFSFSYFGLSILSIISLLLSRVIVTEVNSSLLRKALNNQRY